jgi:hypothetical protein
MNEGERTQVWEGWLSAEIRADYFAELSGKYHQRQRISTWLILVTSSSAFISFVTTMRSELLPTDLTWLVAASLSFFTAALSAYSLIAQNQKNAMDSADLHYRWNKLAGEYERLWNAMDSDQALTRLDDLREKGRELSKVGTAFPVNRRALLKWQQHVEQHHAPHAHAIG